MINKKLFKIVFVFIFIVVVSLKIFSLYKNEQSEKGKIEAESVEVKAVVDYSSRSGTKANVFTNIAVNYIIDGESFYGTIRKQGYKVGNYARGDTILVYIDPITKKIDNY